MTNTKQENMSSFWPEERTEFGAIRDAGEGRGNPKKGESKGEGSPNAMFKLCKRYLVDPYACTCETESKQHRVHYETNQVNYLQNKI